MRVTNELCLSGSACTWVPLCLFVHVEEVNNQVDALRRNTVIEEFKDNKPKDAKKDVEECKSGPGCSWKPLCLFLHPEGGNDHVRAVEKKKRKVKVFKKEEKFVVSKKNSRCRGGLSCA